MKQQIHYRVLFKSIFICYVGACLIHMTMNPGVQPLFSDIFLLVITGISFGIFVYGLLCLVGNIRKTNSFKDLLKEIEKDIDAALKK